MELEREVAHWTMSAYYISTSSNNMFMFWWLFLYRPSRFHTAIVREVFQYAYREYYWIQLQLHTVLSSTYNLAYRPVTGHCHCGCGCGCAGVGMYVALWTGSISDLEYVWERMCLGINDIKVTLGTDWVIFTSLIFTTFIIAIATLHRYIFIHLSA